MFAVLFCEAITLVGAERHRRQLFLPTSAAHPSFDVRQVYCAVTHRTSGVRRTDQRRGSALRPVVAQRRGSQGVPLPGGRRERGSQFLVIVISSSTNLRFLAKNSTSPSNKAAAIAIGQKVGMLARESVDD